MTRRAFAKFHLTIGVGIFVVAAVCVALWWSRQGQHTIRHVVLISIDTCRADYLSCYGDDRQTTPNIDAVAGEGVLFENALAPVPMTLPSHSTMLTGTNPHYHGAHDNSEYRLGEFNVTLAEILKENGFTTGAVIGATVLAEKSGLNQGFETYDDDFQKTINNSGVVDRPAEEVTRQGLKWLQERQDEQFFLLLHYFDPHFRYTPPEPFRSKFGDDFNSRYAGEIAYTDKCIGSIIRHLKNSGAWDHTLLIITADHGEMLGEHGETTHTWFIYQGAIKVPLIVRVPGQHEPRIVSDYVGLIDVVPTVCGLLGLEPPPQVRGVDLSEHWQDDSQPPVGRSIYCESLTPTKYGANSLLGIVADGWKYIQTTRPELYNLTADPTESINLVSAEPQRAQDLQELLRQMLDDQLRSGNESRAGMSETDRRKLESIGYVGGAVVEDFDFEQSEQRHDPKDLIDFHNSNSQVPELIANKYYAEASQLCRQMMAQLPEFLSTYFHLAEIAKKTGDPATAIAHCREALGQDPESAKAHKLLGDLLLQEDELDEAISHFNEALRLRPDFAEVYYYLGNAMARKNRPDEAIAHFSEAIRLQPGMIYAHFNLGNELFRQGRVDDAIAQYKEALQLKPDDVNTHVNLGAALRSTGRMDEAIQQYRRAVDLDPQHATAHHNLGRALMATGQIEVAANHLRTVLKLRPNLAGALNDLARILASAPDSGLREPQEAIRLAELAAKATGNKDPHMLDTLAAAYAAAGRFEEATTTAQQALDLASGHGAEGLADQIRGRLDLYRQNRPYVVPRSTVEGNP